MNAQTKAFAAFSSLSLALFLAACSPSATVDPEPMQSTNAPHVKPTTPAATPSEAPTNIDDTATPKEEQDDSNVFQAGEVAGYEPHQEEMPAGYKAAKVDSMAGWVVYDPHGSIPRTVNKHFNGMLATVSTEAQFAEVTGELHAAFDNMLNIDSIIWTRGPVQGADDTQGYADGYWLSCYSTTDAIVNFYALRTEEQFNEELKACTAQLTTPSIQEVKIGA